MSELRDRLDTLGWTETEPREVYDRRVFALLHELVDEVERLKAALKTQDSMRLEAAS